MTATPIAELAASFRRSLRAAGKADRTLVIYGQSTRFFCEWLAATGRPATVESLNRTTIREWLEHLLDSGNEPSTVATRFRGLRRFCRWLHDEGETEKVATEGVELPAKADKPVRVLTDEEIERLLKVCAAPRGKAGEFDRSIFDRRRDEVTVRLLVDCGLRVSELVGLTIADIDMDQEIVYVVGKGSRPRAVPFSARSGQAVDRYMRQRRIHPRAKTSERLLLGERGPVSADGIRWRMEELGKAAGVSDLHPHALRHTFAHRWLARGGQERDLMHLAGWRSDAMLQVYARSTAISRAHDAHRRMRKDDDL